MGVATAMPTMVADLRGQSLYSWPFTAFLVPSVVATVLAGLLALGFACASCSPRAR
jgi:hypothetical protein